MRGLKRAAPTRSAEIWNRADGRSAPFAAYPPAKAHSNDELAHIIKNYWKRLGYEVNPFVTRVPLSANVHKEQTIEVVRSDLGPRGWPIGRRDLEA